MRRSGGKHFLFRDVHIRVGRAAARLRPVAWNMRRIKTFIDTGAGDQHSRRLCAVTAGASELERDIVRRDVVRERRTKTFFLLRRSVDLFHHLGGIKIRFLQHKPRFARHVFFDAQRKYSRHFFFHPGFRFGRCHLEMRGAFR